VKRPFSGWPQAKTLRGLIIRLRTNLGENPITSGQTSISPWTPRGGSSMRRASARQFRMSCRQSIGVYVFKQKANLSSLPKEHCQRTLRSLRSLVWPLRIQPRIMLLSRSIGRAATFLLAGCKCSSWPLGPFVVAVRLSGAKPVTSRPANGLRLPCRTRGYLRRHEDFRE
jgi:hypothetical protein